MQERAVKEETNGTFLRQGSLRRVLPSSHKEHLFGRQNEDINKFYRIFHQEYVVLAEYKMLQSENLQGIYVIPSKESCLLWFGVIFVRNGFYEDGIFRFNILLPEDFPDGGHPKVVFQSNIFHPVIYKDTNELHLTDGFPTWDKDQHHIWQVLKYLSWIFYNFNSSLAHAVNLEAVNLYRNNQLEFKEKVKECVTYTQDHLYDPSPVDDKHYITFEKYIPSIHDSVRATMMTHESHEERIRASGYSWVSPGSFKPLSK
ncbi:Ubiquitin-conjugating enzyme [Popillia japonica]|uniref:Ubiquitin-conjugating enzyme n=1 Tax=Popillia japonica TaxID=7064 RepID=A0AAW1IC93_POPJA